MLDDLVSRTRTPLYVLAETLIADERDSLTARVFPASQPQQSAAEIQARHARMVVHEIRNALVPVRLALGTLYESIDAAPSTESMTRSRERIDRGVERVFRFIDDMSRVAQLGVTAPSPFDAVEAIRDAIKGLNGGIQLDTSLTADDALPPVLGYRDRFTLAVVNLLRNAAQNSLKARAAVHLRAVLSASLDRVIVTVADDGPGVPDESREDIFQQGFALRAGGSGQGLALVREVVEMEMKGQVRCERSELGGARFVLALPSAARETP
ncbi:MAG: HAMP domain-containing sensor histidine kinase [Deltaproteobacteria bacterium]|nr:HAMP domain-containing sensor histidine kinase [Myxococcales bacterium]MDP3214781.1 HAMP domain-containing sensor histidine kinase [Deltaproteobacteria bacterium]